MRAIWEFVFEHLLVFGGIGHSPQHQQEHRGVQREKEGSQSDARDDARVSVSQQFSPPSGGGSGPYLDLAGQSAAGGRASSFVPLCPC